METWLQELADEFTVDKERLLALFKDSFTASLLGESTFLPCPLDTIPGSDEEGDFFAIDMGGSNLRVALVRLHIHEAPTIVKMEKWTIPAQFKIGRAQDLFAWIATCIGQVKRRQASQDSRKLGVTFSFPVDERSLEGGLIMDMGKAYNLTFSSPDGRCLKALLQTALSNVGIALDVVVCVNDACATLLCQMHVDPRARMSLVLGTGCNAALYLPDQDLQENSAMKRFDDQGKEKHRFVNCELSLLGRDVFPYNKYDAVINAYECNRGFQPIEYATTGPWLGELVRLVLQDIIVLHGFMGMVPSSLENSMSLLTDTLWRIEGDESLDQCRLLLNQRHPLQIGSWTCDQIIVLRRISVLVSTRAADLVAICLMTLKSLLTEEDQEHITSVGYCGSIIESYPNYNSRVQKTLDSLRSDIKLTSIPFSGILGAAIGAACITRQS